MKKILKKLWGVVAAILLLAATALPASATVQTFHAKGEYTMSDYETPEVAEERAFAYAKQSASEQAGVYVTSYTKSTGAQISEDTVKLLSGTLLEVKSKTAHKEAMANGDVHIIVEIAADMDTSAIDRSLQKMLEDRADKVAMYANRQKNIARQAKENEELKQKIAEAKAKGASTENLVRESKAKEREFLSNQKLEEAWKFWEGMQYDAMIAACEEAIRLNPKNAEAYNRRGVAYGNIKKSDLAIADFNRSIALDPNYAMAYSHRGHAYSDKGQYDRAIADYDRAIALDPNFAHAYSNRGVVYSNKGQYDRAIADYDRAIALDSNFAGAYYNRGNDYYRKGNYDQAIADYSRVIALDPNIAVAYYNRGNAYYKKGQYNLAIADFRRALEIAPTFARARNNLQVAINAKARQG